MQIRSKNQIEIQFTKKEKLAMKRKTHGGTKSHAKNARPFVPKKWMQLCNRSDKATGDLSMMTYKNKIYVEKIIRSTAKRYWIVIGDYVNMGNHYHLKIKARRKEDLQNFLRVIHTQIARHVTKAKKGKPFGRFWDCLAFSEILTSAMQELRLKGYFEANRIEAKEGKQKREEYLKEFNKWVNQLKGRSKGKDQFQAKQPYPFAPTHASFSFTY